MIVSKGEKSEKYFKRSSAELFATGVLSLTGKHIPTNKQIRK